MGYKLTWLAFFALIMILFAFGRTGRKKKILFFGDSITQAGVQPNGYITMLQSKLKTEGLDENIDLIGAGISGNKIYDLYLRMDEDVMSKSPDMVFIYIGVNDVWHKSLLGTGTDYDKFGKFYEAVINKLKAANIKVVLCTPAVIGERKDHSNQQDGDLNLYSQWIRDYAKKHSLDIVDLRHSFLAYNLENNPNNQEKGILTTDRVHLNDKGNDMVASEMLKVIRAAYGN